MWSAQQIESLHNKLVQFESRLSSKLNNNDQETGTAEVRTLVAAADAVTVALQQEDPQKRLLEELVEAQKRQIADQEAEMAAVLALKDDEIRRLSEKLEELSKMVATQMATEDSEAVSAQIDSIEQPMGTTELDNTVPLQ